MIAPRLPPGRFPGSHRYSEAAFFLTSGLPIDTKLHSVFMDIRTQGAEKLFLTLIVVKFYS